jgi:hypothetical protein
VSEPIWRKEIRPYDLYEYQGYKHPCLVTYGAFNDVEGSVISYAFKSWGMDRELITAEDCSCVFNQMTSGLADNFCDVLQVAKGGDRE